MRVHTTKSFDKDYQKLDKELQKRVDNKLLLFIQSNKHPSLQIKKMEGCDIWEARISRGYRFTFQLQESVCVLRRVGNHNILKKP